MAELTKSGYAAFVLVIGGFAVQDVRTNRETAYKDTRGC